MKKSFTIGEISELLGIPKSTLRYWDSIGLINLNRNKENNYREYSLSTVYSISDLVYYRNIKMPLEDMKKLPELTPGDLETALDNLDRNLLEEIEKLQSAKNYLDNRLKHIQEYKILNQNPFIEKAPNFSQIYTFPYFDKASWKVCIKNPYEYALYYNLENNELQSGLIESASLSCSQIWKYSPDTSKYLAFTLKTNYSDPSPLNYEYPLSVIENMGLKVRCIISRYLFSSCEEIQYDYYAAYAELIP